MAVAPLLLMSGVPWSPEARSTGIGHSVANDRTSTVSGMDAADVRVGGPLAGVKVVEIAGIGPAPFAGMVLADLGAERGAGRPPRPGPGCADRAPRPHRAGQERHRRRSQTEGGRRGRPPSRRRLPDPDRRSPARSGRTPRHSDPRSASLATRALVYGRMTGWGQSGPLAPTAGHDINYLAVSGNLSAIGPADRPYPPLNLVADYGGGAMLLLGRNPRGSGSCRATGEGQVVDAAMVDGSALLASLFRGMIACWFVGGRA